MSPSSLYVIPFKPVPFLRLQKGTAIFQLNVLPLNAESAWIFLLSQFAWIPASLVQHREAE